MPPTSQCGLRVLMVTPAYPPEIGGVEVHVANTAQRLAARGAEVTVLTTTHDRNAVGRTYEHGVDVVRVRAHLGFARWAPAVVHEMRAGRWDVVHVQSYHTFVAPLAMKTARELGIPYVVTFHGGGSSSSWQPKIRSVQVKALGGLLRDAARLVAVARFEIGRYGDLLGVGADRFAHIPNGADLPPAGAVGPIDPTGPIVSMGRLERYKGHHRVIAAMPAVLESRPELQLEVVGSGPYGDELATQVRELGIEHAVTIRAIPAAERSEMAALLASASVVTLLSDFETHPIGALEAISLGRQLLVNDTSGMAELVERGQAIGMTEVDDAAAVARRIVELLDDPRPPATTAIPTWDDCTTGLVDLYESVADLDAEELACAS